MTKADIYIEHLDSLRQPVLTNGRGHAEYQCALSPVIGVDFLMARGKVLAVNHRESDQGFVKATFDAHAHVHAIVWYVPKGARARRG